MWIINVKIYEKKLLEENEDKESEVEEDYGQVNLSVVTYSLYIDFFKISREVQTVSLLYHVYCIYPWKVQLLHLQDMM